MCKEKKPSADSENFSDEKDSGNNLAPVEQEEKKEKNSARKERTQFVPPTLEEVKDYEAQKGYTFSGILRIERLASRKKSDEELARCLRDVAGKAERRK